ncbi:hypothetical protein CHRY9390_00504 [Chryseobacterium aquaeductus]|uniref:Uncharacterized protein n=1 Tax=Chryseobacterium aquaeductus TaxID=2675056 RepID=A0A9N8MFS5_9FLAO|nr:hypothetical protein CHRY9390_00504 [Chryseobacterium potabilaquae]CAD7799562.1 hypothetical protein CHRY9390_00504 [Chryseobacterium aquaeductus]
MRKFILVFFGVLLFDLIYVLIYDQFLIDIEPEFLKYPLLILKFIASSPAIFFNKLLPFYAPIPFYQSILMLLGDTFLQALLIYSLFFNKKKSTI